MTNDNQFKPTNQHFKELKNIPQTETRIILNDWSQEAKKSKLSPAARNKVINRSGSNYLSESKDYGPCSYSGCPHSTPFNVSITIEGKSRNWANTGWNAFPGYWKPESHIFGSYSWREDLYLNQINQARDAISFMNSDNLYVVNAAGLFCVENGKFCNNAKRIINECVSHHERGGKVDETEIIGSDLHKYAKWTVRAAVIAGVSAVTGPVGAAATGTAIWGTGKALEHHPDANEYDKGIFRSISGFGEDLVKGELVGATFKAGGQILGAVGTSGSRIGQEAGREWGKYADWVNTGAGTVDDWGTHDSHTRAGVSYKSNCNICNYRS